MARPGCVPVATAKRSSSRRCAPVRGMKSCSLFKRKQPASKQAKRVKYKSRNPSRSHCARFTPVLSWEGVYDYPAPQRPRPHRHLGHHELCAPHTVGVVVLPRVACRRFTDAEGKEGRKTPHNTSKGWKGLAFCKWGREVPSGGSANSNRFYCSVLSKRRWELLRLAASGQPQRCPWKRSSVTAHNNRVVKTSPFFPRPNPHVDFRHGAGIPLLNRQVSLHIRTKLCR